MCELCTEEKGVAVTPAPCDLHCKRTWKMVGGRGPLLRSCLRQSRNPREQVDSSRRPGWMTRVFCPFCVWSVFVVFVAVIVVLMFRGRKPP